MKKQLSGLKVILIPAALIVLAGAVYFTVNKNNQAAGTNSKPLPVVRVQKVRTEQISRGFDLTGSVEPYRIARLATPAEGPVESLYVREGDSVQAGDLLTSIGRVQGVDAQLKGLLEEEKKEKENLDKIRRLVAQKALPGESLDQAENAYQRIRTERIRAEENARDYQIKAPWNGIVSHIHVHEGEYAAPRSVLLEMYDPKTLVIRAAVPERFTTEIRKEIPVKIQLDAFHGQVFKGKVDRVHPYLDSRLRSRIIEIIPLEPIDLFPGMFARLEVQTGQIDHAIVIPSEALVTVPKGLAVFSVRDNKAVLNMVKTGVEDGNRIQILSGLRVGDMVIIAGNEKLKEGMSVRIAERKNPDAGIISPTHENRLPGDKQP
jgi:RND family efflux transporter MFP subunit